MKKENLKFFITSILILVSFFSLFFISNKKVLAQDKIDPLVETTGYSVLSPKIFIFGGYYSGNVDKKGFITYFEYKKDDSNLGSNQDETIKIVRDAPAGVDGVFYTSPELKMFSTYYFRAVGCFGDVNNNDECIKDSPKFYGNTMIMDTGYLPINPPFTFFINIGVSVTMVKDYLIIDYNIPDTCDFLSGLIGNNCNPAVKKTCPPEQTLINGSCVDKKPKTINGGWTGWSVWGTCSVTACGQTGTQTRTRTCTNPYPSPDGLDCVGLSTNAQSCTTAACVDDNPKDTDTDTDTGLVPCGGPGQNSCGFYDILTLINKIVKFILLNLAVPIAAIMFAYAGFELLTSGGETSKREKAKSIFTNVAIGLALVAAAFLIVQTILSIVGYNTGNGWNWFGF